MGVIHAGTGSKECIRGVGGEFKSNNKIDWKSTCCCFHVLVNLNHVQDKILPAETNFTTPSFGVPLEIYVWERHTMHLPVCKVKHKSCNKIYIKLDGSDQSPVKHLPHESQGALHSGYLLVKYFSCSFEVDCLSAYTPFHSFLQLSFQILSVLIIKFHS